MQPGVAGELRMERCHHDLTLSSYDRHPIVFGQHLDIGPDRHDLRCTYEHGVERSIEADDFGYAPFSQRGGLGKAHQLFGEQLPRLLDELNEVLAALFSFTPIMMLPLHDLHGRILRNARWTVSGA